MCEYFFRRHDYRLDNAAKRKWYNLNREDAHYTQQYINFNENMQIASPSMNMGMRIGGGRR